jgi:hypothetical protein
MEEYLVAARGVAGDVEGREVGVGGLLAAAEYRRCRRNVAAEVVEVRAYPVGGVGPGRGEQRLPSLRARANRRAPDAVRTRSDSMRWSGWRLR